MSTSRDLKYSYGVGRRKASTARAKYYPSDAVLEIFANGKKADEYFPQYYYQTLTIMASNAGISNGRIELFIRGGGTMGQSDAARLAIAKALVKQDEAYKPVLRLNNYLSTDIRKVLSKRPGRRKARKSEQWSKR